jgi:hypothetical protein
MRSIDDESVGRKIQRTADLVEAIALVEAANTSS